MFSRTLLTDLAERSDARHVVPRLMSGARAVAAAMRGPDLLPTSSALHSAGVTPPRGRHTFVSREQCKIQRSLSATSRT